MRLLSLIPIVVIALCSSECRSATIELNGLFGEFTSPGYPQPYNDDEDITWVITTDPGYQIVVYFTVFDLEDSYDEDLGGACVYDYVQIEDWGTTRRYCGNNKHYPADAPKYWQRFRSENNTMIVKFVSDYSNEDPRPVGFRAHYIVEDKDECEEMKRLVRTTVEDWDELIYCNHFCINTPGSYYCSCRTGFELHENRHTCKASCENQVITSDEGVIESPDYPRPYSRLTDCDWTIQVCNDISQQKNYPNQYGRVKIDATWATRAPHTGEEFYSQPSVRAGLSLNLQFEQVFSIEDHFNHTECVYDYLKISYAESSEEYCHEVPAGGNLISTNTRQVRLDFHTDNAIEEAGFRMNFTTTRTRCLSSRNAPANGRKSPNPKGYYEFEDRIEFECDPGYNLVPVDGAVVSCLSDGSWDKAAPICEIKSCGPPVDLQSVPYSHIVDVMNYQFTFGDIIVLECDEWYELDSGTTEWRCSEDAEWVATDPFESEEDLPVCTPVCGIKNGTDRPLFGVQIAGGDVANPHEWPWMVFLNFGYRSNVAAIHGTCGGALISPDFVLTAAHCVKDEPRDYPPHGVRFPNNTHVWLGAHNRLQDRGQNSIARNVRVAEVIVHPQYNLKLWDSDIALLRLAETVVMDAYVRPICLPKTTQEINMLVPGVSSGEVAGWGLSTSRRRASYELRFTELPTVNRATCWSSFQSTAEMLNITLDSNLVLTENMFCAGFRSGGTGATCEGDSGGPYMLLNDHDRKYYTHGIVSFGVARTRCGESVSYSVFAKLTSENLRWIYEIIEG